MNRWDLFDVHSGLVSMEAYLRQRHSEEDLQTTIEVPEDQVTEFIKPPPPRPELPPPRPPGPEFVVEEPEPAPPPTDVDDLIKNFHNAVKDWEDRNRDS